LCEAFDDGVIGEVGSVHFEWLLDVRHGADYFRRWHRDKANSGGLLVHKSDPRSSSQPGCAVATPAGTAGAGGYSSRPA